MRKRSTGAACRDPQRSGRVLALALVGLFVAAGARDGRAACGDFGLPDGSEIVELETTLGSICVEMLRDAAPATVANFVGYVERGDYDGTIFHRSVPGFIVQGGGFASSGETLAVVPSAGTVDNEPCTRDITVPPGNTPACSVRGNVAGNLAMAKQAGNPNSATSQWFVNLADNRANLDNQNGGFTVFARVLGDGMSVVNAIATLPLADEAAGYFFAPPFGGALGSLPLLAETPALDAPFGCWDPSDLSIIVEDPGGPNPFFEFLPDPETGLDYFLSNACGTRIPRGSFVADPGPPACPDADILGVAVTDPIALGARLDPATNDFLQFEFSCAQTQEALVQRALWQADLRTRMSPQLVVVERARVRVVPEPMVTAGVVAALGALGALRRARESA